MLSKLLSLLRRSHQEHCDFCGKRVGSYIRERDTFYEHNGSVHYCDPQAQAHETEAYWLAAYECRD